LIGIRNLSLTSSAQAFHLAAAFAFGVQVSLWKKRHLFCLVQDKKLATKNLWQGSRHNKVKTKKIRSYV